MAPRRHRPRVKPRFIVNPRSGDATRALPAVLLFAARHGGSVVLTERPRHASELAARALAEGCDLVVAVGGDGTMNEVAAVLTGTPGTLGLVPCGSGDGLGRHLGIHGSVARALDLLQRGATRRIDTGLADGHPFVSVAGLGFEAEIAQRFNRLQHRGFFRYLTTSALALREWQAANYVVTHAGGRDEFRAFTVAVANSNQYGNHARIAPAARLDDGRLDLCAVPPVTLGNALPLLSRLFAGTLARTPGVLCRQAERFVIERASPGPLHTDGEIHEAGRTVVFSVRPASLRIIVPHTVRPGESDPPFAANAQTSG